MSFLITFKKKKTPQKKIEKLGVEEKNRYNLLTESNACVIKIVIRQNSFYPKKCLEKKKKFIIVKAISFSFIYRNLKQEKREEIRVQGLVQTRK